MSHNQQIHIVDFTPNKQAEVERLIEKYSFFLPNWLHELVISSDPCSDGNILDDITTNTEYHVAYMTIKSSMFALDPYEREQSFVHELSHIYVDEINRFIGDLIATYVKDESCKTILEAVQRKTKESLTDNISWAVISRAEEDRVQPFELLVYEGKPMLTERYPSKIVEP